MLLCYFKITMNVKKNNRFKTHKHTLIKYSYIYLPSRIVSLALSCLLYSKSLSITCLCPL